MNYNNTPSTTTKVAPNKLIFSYTPRTVLNSLKKIEKSNINYKENIEKNRKKEFSIKHEIKDKDKICFKKGEKVLYRNHFKDIVKWIPAVICEVVSPLTYLIKTENRIRFVHKNQLRLSNLNDKFHSFHLKSDEFKSNNNQANLSNSPITPLVIRRSNRKTTPPKRLRYSRF